MATNLARLFRATNRDQTWRVVDATPLDFNVLHPQGLVRVGDVHYMTTVGILEPTRRYPMWVDGRGTDRTPGHGEGWLIELRAGRKRREIRLDSSDDAYHVGGLGHDGERLWVPVAQYRPGPRTSLICSVRTDTLELRQELEVEDHIGLVAAAPDGPIVGGNWDCRTFYVWESGGGLLRKVDNPVQSIDFQDSTILTGEDGEPLLLCGGVSLTQAPNGEIYEQGGLALFTVPDMRLLWEIPFRGPETPGGHVATYNAQHVRTAGERIELEVVADAGEGRQLLTYQTPPLHPNA